METSSFLFSKLVLSLMLYFKIQKENNKVVVNLGRKDPNIASWTVPRIVPDRISIYIARSKYKIWKQVFEYTNKRISWNAHGRILIFEAALHVFRWPAISHVVDAWFTYYLYVITLCFIKAVQICHITLFYCDYIMIMQPWRSNYRLKNIPRLSM